MTEPRTNDRQHDRELEDYLAGRHALSVRYLEASRETAPPELDAVILASARVAAASRPRRRARWRVPLAAAATMVLGVSLVSQLRDDAVPEAVRSDGETPALRQAPTPPEASASEKSQMLSMDSVAERVAPAESVKAPAPAPADQAKPAAPPAPQNEVDAPPRQEQEAAMAPKQRQQAAERRERAQADGFSAAPQARAQRHAFAPAPAPAPVSGATLDQVSIAARDLLLLLQSQDIEALTAHASTVAHAQVKYALPLFASAHSAQILPRSDDEQIWRVAIADERGRTLGHAAMNVAGQTWQLIALEPPS